MRVSIGDHFDCHCKTSSQDKNMSSMEAGGGEDTGGSHMDFFFLTPYQADSWTTTCCTRIVTTLLKCVQILTTASRCELAQRLRHMARGRTPPAPPRGSTRKMDFVHLINGFLRPFKVSKRTHAHARTRRDWSDSCYKWRCAPAACHMDSSFIDSR